MIDATIGLAYLMSWAPGGIVADKAPPKRGRAISLLVISSQAEMQVKNAGGQI